MTLFGPRYPVLQTVIVNTKTDKSFRGVLWSWRRGLVVLRNAVMLQPRGESVRLDGELVIEAGNVDFIQVVA